MTKTDRHLRKRQFESFPGATKSSARPWRVRPFVSVVLPVYNQAMFIADSVRSVLAHQRFPLELIVINDGSTDDPRAALEEFATDPRIRVIDQANAGIAAALNRGFQEAQGSFLTWTSADNHYRVGALDALADYLLDNPSIGLVYANVQLISDSGEVLRASSYRKADQSPEDSSILLLPLQSETLCELNDNFLNSCFLYRRECAEAVGAYRSEYLGYEDYDYWLRILQLTNIAHLDSDEALYHYRIHDNSLTATLETAELADKQLAVVKRSKLARDLSRRGIAISLRAPLGLTSLRDDLAEALQSSGSFVTRGETDQVCILLEPLEPNQQSVLRAQQSRISKFGCDLQFTRTSLGQFQLSYPCPPLQLNRSPVLATSSVAEAESILLPALEVPKVIKRARDGCLGAITPGGESNATLLYLPPDSDLGDEAAIWSLQTLATLMVGNPKLTFALFCESKPQRLFADQLNLSLASNQNLRIVDVSDNKSEDPLDSEGSLASLMYVLASSDIVLSCKGPKLTASTLCELRVEAAIAAAAGCNLIAVCTNDPVSTPSEPDVQRLQSYILAMPHLAIYVPDSPDSAEEFTPLAKRASTPAATASLDQWLNVQSREQLAANLMRQLYLDT